MPTERISLAEARRVALAAQGFADARPKSRVDRRHLRRAVDRMGLIQIDAVNVLVRSQELPLFARLGPHPRDLIDNAARAGELFETWVHEACHADTRHYHLYRWRMARSRVGATELHERRPGYVEEVYRRIAGGGPVVSGELSERTTKKDPWWDWDDAKHALEHLFATGRLAAVRRAGDFARIYDLAERVIPAEALARPAVPEDDARRQLIELAARYHGVATVDDLDDYHRMRNKAQTAVAVAELVDDGVLVPVAVEGWKQQGYLHRDARMPRRVDACALLSPFDPLVWHRPRAERLFGFTYRLEIYTPAAKRIYGYFVLPVLHGDRLVGRLDLKADRAARRLLVRSAHTEAETAAETWAPRAAAELTAMATWLDLDGVTVEGNGGAAPALTAAVAAAAR